MSVFDMIMGEDYDESEGFSREDWSQLGQGNITDEVVIGKMLAEGYENCIG